MQRMLKCLALSGIYLYIMHLLFLFFFQTVVWVIDCLHVSVCDCISLVTSNGYYKCFCIVHFIVLHSIANVLFRCFRIDFTFLFHCHFIFIFLFFGFVSCKRFVLYMFMFMFVCMWMCVWIFCFYTMFNTPPFHIVLKLYKIRFASALMWCYFTFLWLRSLCKNNFTQCFANALVFTIVHSSSSCSFSSSASPSVSSSSPSSSPSSGTVYTLCTLSTHKYILYIYTRSSSTTVFVQLSALYIFIALQSLETILLPKCMWTCRFSATQCTKYWNSVTEYAWS